MPSPITGSAGKIEFLLHARTPTTRPPASVRPAAALEELVEQAVAEAHTEIGPG
jgi:hypothetical protein